MSAHADGPTVLLDAWAAASCPVKTQNAFDPAVTLPGSAVASECNTDLFAGSAAFIDSIDDRLARLPGAADLRTLPGGSRADATARSLALGAPVVIGPQLPASPLGHREGSPEVLVRVGATEEERPGYLPVVITRHSVLERHHTRAEFTWLAGLDDPSPRRAALSSEQTFRPARQRPLLQAAHYWRLLEDLRLLPARGTPADRLAGIVGTDLVDEHPVVAWLDLDHRFIRTFSRTATSGWRARSALDRYDHEHGFRVSVAAHAAAGAQPPMVSPIVVRECESCQWWSRCQPRLDDADLSLRISKAPLDVREIATLRRLGVSTVDDLAAADLDALMPAYLPEVQHRPEPEHRLRVAARRARLIRDGVALERNDTGPIRLPASRLEIDLDIETSPDDRVYLWGLWVDDPHCLMGATAARPDRGAAPYYLSFSSFEELDDLTEAALAADAVAWLDRAVRTCPDCLIVHYSDYELVHLRRFARNFSRKGSPVYHPEAARQSGRVLESGHFLDLFTVMRRHFFGAAGLGLKAVAQAGPGFHWRDAEPGGLNSQTWWSQAVDGPGPAVRRAAGLRVLRYNEDDVRATHALRVWLREKHG